MNAPLRNIVRWSRNHLFYQKKSAPGQPWSAKGQPGQPKVSRVRQRSAVSGKGQPGQAKVSRVSKHLRALVPSRCMSAWNSWMDVWKMCSTTHSTKSVWSVKSARIDPLCVEIFIYYRCKVHPLCQYISIILCTFTIQKTDRYRMTTKVERIKHIF